MRNHLRFFGSLLLVATLCVPTVSFAQTNAEERGNAEEYGNVEDYGDPMNAPAADSLDSTNGGERFDIQLPGETDYSAASVTSDDDDMQSLFVYGGLLMLTLLCIGTLILATKARRKPPQRIQF